MRVLMEYFVHKTEEQRQRLKDLKKVVWVNPVLGLSKEQLSLTIEELGMENEPLILFLNPIDPDLLQGIIFIERGIGYFDQELEPLFPYNTCVVYHRKRRPETDEKSVDSLRQALNRMIRKADGKIEEARAHSEQLRELFQSNVTAHSFTELKEKLMVYLENPVQDELPDPLFLQDSLYGAFTCKGPRYFTYPLCEDIKRWIVLKGHAEAEISRLIREIKEWADHQGLPNKVDRCPLYSNEIDRLLLPTLQTGLIDGNLHHPFEPVYPQDQVLDLDHHFLNEETIYYFAPEIKEYQARYKQKMRQGTLFLQEAANDLWALIQLYEPLALRELLAI